MFNLMEYKMKQPERSNFTIVADNKTLTNRFNKRKQKKERQQQRRNKYFEQNLSSMGDMLPQEIKSNKINYEPIYDKPIQMNKFDYIWAKVQHNNYNSKGFDIYGYDRNGLDEDGFTYPA